MATIKYLKADITGISSTSLLDCDLNYSQIIFNNKSTTGFDNTSNIALQIFGLVKINLILLKFWSGLETLN
jgi:hypothetical protein